MQLRAREVVEPDKVLKGLTAEKIEDRFNNLIHERPGWGDMHPQPDDVIMFYLELYELLEYYEPKLNQSEYYKPKLKQSKKTGTMYCGRGQEKSSNSIQKRRRGEDNHQGDKSVSDKRRKL